MIKKHDKVIGVPLFGDKEIQGTVINTDANTSRDALIVQLDTGEQAIMLTQNARKIDKKQELQNKLDKLRVVGFYAYGSNSQDKVLKQIQELEQEIEKLPS